MAPRGGRALVAVGLALLLTACSATPSPRPTLDVVTDALAAAPASDPVPSAEASARLADAVVRLVAGGGAVPDGWQLVPLSDVPEGHALVERARPGTAAGVYAVRGRSATAVAIAVPVPGGSGASEQLGVDLFVRSRALALAVAGSPTAAASVDSPFRRATEALTERGIVLAVVEGFAADTAAGSPEVVLQGADARPSDEELRLGTVLAAAAVETCVLVDEQCIDPNVALEASEEPPAGGPVVRVQLAGRLATDAARRDVVLGEIATALDDL